MAKVYDNATDLITFARSSYGTALRRVGYGDDLAITFSKTGDNGTNTVTLYDDGYDINQVDASSLARAYINGTFEANKTYVLAGDYTVSSGSFKIDQSNLAGGAITVSGHTVFRPLTAVTSIGIYRNAIPSAATFRNISVKEVIFDRATDDLVLFDHPDDIPRIEYAADGSLKGLLIEEQRTNLVTYSEDLTQWNNFSGETSVTLSSDTIYGVSAYEVTGSTGGYGLGRISPNGGASINLTSDGVLTFWAKKVTAGATLLYLWNGTVYNFDSQVPNDGEWHKVEVTLAAANSQLQLLRGFTSGTVALAMPQLELGSFPTSYIPTSGSQKTRDPDIASIPVSAFGYNQEAGTVVVEASFNSRSDGQTFHRTIELSNDWSSRLAMFDDASNPNEYIRYFVRDDTASNVFGAANLSGSDQSEVNLAIAYAADDMAIYGGNGQSATGSSGQMGADVTTLNIGKEGNDTSFLNGHIKSIQYYPRRLTDAQLQELTS